MGLGAKLSSLRKAGVRSLFAKVMRRVLRNPAVAEPPRFAATPAVPPPDPTSVRDALDRRFRDLQSIPHLHVETPRPRLTLVLDEFERLAAPPPFDGAAALAGTALAARMQGIPLRLVTRRSPVPARAVLDALASQGVAPPADLSYFTDAGRDVAGRQAYKLEVGMRDRFVASSWRTAAACRATSLAPRVVWWVRDDEAALLPAGDERALCDATFADDGFDFVVETRRLFDALAARYPAVARHGISYEPAFPDGGAEAGAGTRADAGVAANAGAPGSVGRRRRMLFAARPDDPATLYGLGLEALSRALADGVLDPAAWEILCAGAPASALRFPDGTAATVLQGCDRKAYRALLSGVDLVLAPHATVRIGSPALEAAASGATVVTTTTGERRDGMDRCGVLVVEPTVDAIVGALRTGAVRAADAARNADPATGATSWALALAPVLAWLEARSGDA